MLILRIPDFLYVCADQSRISPRMKGSGAEKLNETVGVMDISSCERLCRRAGSHGHPVKLSGGAKKGPGAA